MKQTNELKKDVEYWRVWAFTPYFENTIFGLIVSYNIYINKLKLTLFKNIEMRVN